MIRRITLTLGMGVAVMAAGSRSEPAPMVASPAPAVSMAAPGAKPVGPRVPRTPHRSGYIVASS